MNSDLCQRFGIEFPLIAPGHCRYVAAAVSRAGGKRVKQLTLYWIGQGGGLMDEATSAAAVVREFNEDYLAAIERPNATLEE